MLVFVGIAVLCACFFLLTLFAFDDIHFGNALDFGDDGGAGWFSLRALLMFGLGFGAIGALAMNNGYTAGAASMLATGAGGVTYLIAIGASVMMARQESNSIISLQSLVGRDAYVTGQIKPGFLGEVRIGSEYREARTDGDVILNGGQRVTVERVTGSVLWVKGASDGRAA